MKVERSRVLEVFHLLMTFQLECTLKRRVLMQGQSSKRVVKVSHESHAGNGMTAQNSRSDYQGSEPAEMRMPLQMPPVPVHMHPRAPQPEQFSLLYVPPGSSYGVVPS